MLRMVLVWEAHEALFDMIKRMQFASDGCT